MLFRFIGVFVCIDNGFLICFWNWRAHASFFLVSNGLHILFSFIDSALSLCLLLLTSGASVASLYSCAPWNERAEEYKKKNSNANAPHSIRIDLSPPYPLFPVCCGGYDAIDFPASLCVRRTASLQIYVYHLFITSAPADRLLLFILFLL